MIIYGKKWKEWGSGKQIYSILFLIARPISLELDTSAGTERIGIKQELNAEIKNNFRQIPRAFANTESISDCWIILGRYRCEESAEWRLKQRVPWNVLFCTWAEEKNKTAQNGERKLSTVSYSSSQ